MLIEGEFCFGRYRLHPVQGLKCSGREVRVTPKSLALLALLARRAGEVVTKEELFRVVWPGTVVSDAALATCIRELRQALDDDARHPRFIETVHRRGYRFLPGGSGQKSRTPSRAGTRAGVSTQTLIVGRDPPLEQLSAALREALEGRRQMLFISGEPGIGKTCLLEAFLAEAGEVDGLLTARADCVDRYGSGEAYQPLLEAIARLCRQSGNAVLTAELRRYAPSWLAQLPALQTGAELQALQRQTVGTTPARMLRELNDALEAMTAISPLVLCIEDLHWSDLSTLDWIASFARRPEQARLLLVCTYRAEEASSVARPLRALCGELHMKGLCQEIALGGLAEAAVHELFTARFPPDADSEPALERLAGLVYRHTEGNPLFLVNVLGDLIANGYLVERNGRWAVAEGIGAASLSIPEDVRRLIELKADNLEAGRRNLLEVASVLGGQFSAAAVSAAGELELAGTEQDLRELARQGGFVRETGTTEWPDGTVAAGFEFLHALYREVLNERLSPTRRAGLHRRIGERLEAAYRERAPEIAAELALQFDHARDARRAIIYLKHAAETDRRRSANQEAKMHLRRALELLKALPVSSERDELEVALRIALGAALMATDGFGAPEVEECYATARELCQRLGRTTQLFPVVWGMWLFYLGRGSVRTTRELADALQKLPRSGGNSTLRLQMHHAQWATALSEGNIRAVEEHSSAGICLYDPGQHAGLTSTYGDHDAGVCALSFSARAAVLAGRTELAVQQSAEAIALARNLGHPFTLTLGLAFAAFVHQVRRDALMVRQHAVEASALAGEHGFLLMLGWATVLEGWATVETGDSDNGLRLMRTGTGAARATGSGLFQPLLFSLLAEAEFKCGLHAEAFAHVEEAFGLAERNGDRLATAELYRLRGELRLAAARDCESGEHDLSHAIETAKGQGANLLALRSATSLGRHWAAIGKPHQARRVVAARRAGIPYGPGLADLADAEALLAELG